MASVFLGELDDFIAPGQACVNPLFAPPKAKPAADNEKGDSATGGAAMQLVLEDDGGAPLDTMQVVVIVVAGEASKQLERGGGWTC